MSNYQWKNPMTAKEVIKELVKNGWELVSQKGSHKKFKKNGKSCIVADHGNNNIPTGTLNSIKNSVKLAEDNI
jgi:predicted RNA binding protein YcfA (HicA-like mRNA interferase family)